MFQVVYAQKTVTGTVRDQNNNPLEGVSVNVKGTRNTVVTTSGGTFSINAPENATLVFSIVGYGAREVSVAGQSSIDVSLTTQESSLNEVVVIGYGTARRKDITGAVSSVTARNFNKGIQPAPDQLIQGKVPGVQVVNNSGAPGAGTTVRIRGTSSIRADNQPLFVIDGVPLNNGNSRPDIGLTDVGGGTPAGNPLNFINPNDIASMEVLKDASATAIYGSRGANGVVIITTKKGQSGAPRIDINSSVGMSKILKRLEVLDGNQYRQALGEYGFPTTVSTPSTPTANFGGNVDALGEILRTAVTTNNNVAISSGNENARYRISLGYLNQEGIIRKTGFEKYTANFSSNFKMLESRKLGLDVNIITSQTIENIAPISNTAGFKGSLIGQALQWNPTKPLRNSNGSLNIEYGSDNINPLAYSEAYNDKAKITTILASISPSYKITSNLEYRMLLSVNYATGLRQAYTSANININDVAKAYNTSRADTIGGEATSANIEIIARQITNTLSYVKDINSKFSLNATLGHEYLKTTNSGGSNYARGFPLSNIPLYQLFPASEPGTRRLNSFSNPIVELQSFFGRAILSFDNRFVFSAIVRADGSSKFGSNNKYGIFPALAASWNLSRESFLSSNKTFNDLRLRASWGITGNQEFVAGASQRIYSLTGANPATFQQTQIANPDLQWEEVKTLNFGLDFALLSSRLSGSVDYFIRNTGKILFPREAADPVTPNSAVRWENLPNGKIENKGLEIALTVGAVRGSKFNWDISANATFLQNKLKDFGSFQLPTGEVNGQGLSGAYSQLLVDNQPLNSFYLKKFIGIDKNTGISIYEGGEEKFFLGSPNPTMLVGLTNNISYNKLSFEFALQGAMGHYIYNNTANAILAFNNLGKRNIGQRELGIAKSVGEQPVNPTSASSRYLEKGDYLRLANATLSYRIGNIGRTFKSANVFVTGQNLFIITSFTGFDPEVNVSKPLNNIPSFGMEYTPYPTSRTFTLGVNFGF